MQRSDGSSLWASPQRRGREVTSRASLAERVARVALVSVPRFLLGLLIFVGIGINFANVVGRYVFSSPFVWAEEILVFIMIWCVFIGAVLVTWEGRHIKMDLLSAKLIPPWRQIVNALTNIGFVLVCLFVIIQSWDVVSLLLETGQQTVIARLPAGMMHASVLVGFGGMLLALLLRWRSHLHGEFGSDADAVTKQLVETYGTVGEDAGEPPR